MCCPSINPLILFETCTLFHFFLQHLNHQSPCAFPVVAMVMYSITSTSPEVYPPINTPLVELEAPPAVSLAADKYTKILLHFLWLK